MRHDAVRKAMTGAAIERGVWVAQWLGENGETILVAVRRNGRRVAERLLGVGDDHLGAADELWRLLDDADPPPPMRLVI